MTSELIVGGALANCGRDAPTDEFLQMLVRETTDLAVFRFRPKARQGLASASKQRLIGKPFSAQVRIFLPLPAFFGLHMNAM